MEAIVGDRTLKAHREALAKNPTAYSTDLPRIQQTAVGHLKRCGFSRVTRSRCRPLVDRFVNAIFDTQNCRPFFHVKSPLPFCWNRPTDWNKDFIRYEWGHLRSLNQNDDAHQIENICLQSARCNQHIQTSMDITEVLEWLKSSAVEVRVKSVLERRQQLFVSTQWKQLLADLEPYR
jgi:hypothetical protein